jgi:hypothetical protein
VIKAFHRRSTFFRVALLTVCSILCTSFSLVRAQYYNVRTKDLNLVYYDSAHSYVVPHLTRCFENSLNFHRHLFHYTPGQEIGVFLDDFDDYGKAGAGSVPFNYLSLGIEPYKYVFETSPTNERFNWVMNHELTHIVAVDKATSGDEFFRSIFFGRPFATADHPISMVYSYLATPRLYSPRWYHEGIAVFLETWMSGGIGRALGGYDEMVFRAMVRDSSYFYDVVGLQSEGTTIDFQVGVNAYLYGTRFVSYLALTYGPEKVLEWFSRTEDSKAFFATQFEHVYHKPLDQAWSDWIGWEHQWQSANLDSIRAYPTTRFRPVSTNTLGSVSRSFFDPVHRKIYAAINYPGQLAHIASIDIDNGTLERVCDVTGPSLYSVASVAYDSSTSTMFFTTHNKADWRHLRAVDLRTGRSRMLFKNARTGDLAFNRVDKSLWGVLHEDGLSTIVRFPPPYDTRYRILVLDYGKDLFDIDISPDGKYLTGSFLEISGRQTLVRMEIEKLLEGKGEYEVLMEFDNNTSPEGFVFSPDGRYLFGTSYYTGVSNVFRYDLETGERNVLTNAETGFFLPLPVSDDSLVVFDYTGHGFVPVVIANQPCFDVSAVRYLGQEIVDKYPIVRTWTVGSPLSVNYDSVVVSTGEYDGLANLKLQSAFPIVDGYKDYTSVGMRFNFLDPFQFYYVNANLSYSPSPTIPRNERLHAKVNFESFRWTLTGGYNSADFYDLFGPTKKSRKGYYGSLQYSNYLIFDTPEIMEYTLRVAGYGGQETLPEYQNIATSFDKFYTLSGGLSYENLRKSLGAVDSEAGVRWEINSHNNYANAKMFPLLYTNFDYGFLLPIDHSFVWLRTSFGYSFREGEDPFANFYFGGFGNNWVDHQTEKRYREYYSFPGVELNGIGGTNYGKAMLEWTLPPLRFRHFGVMNAYLTWARLAFFTSGIIMNIDSAPDQRKLLDVGAQLDLRFVLFSRLDATLSFGYAGALERNRRTQREFMVSLKIF